MTTNYRYSLLTISQKYTVERDEHGVTIFGLGRVLGKAGTAPHPTAQCRVDCVVFTDAELRELQRVISLMLETRR